MHQIFHPREGLGGPRMKGNPPMAVATCPAFARRSRSTIFPPSASVVPFCRRGLAFLDDSDGASILARGSYGRGILQHMPSSNPPRTYLGSASPLGNNALPFASPRRRVSGKVLPVSIDWCIPRGNNVSVCSMRVSYNEPIPSRRANVHRGRNVHGPRQSSEGAEGSQPTTDAPIGP